MNRKAALHEITGLFGEALKAAGPTVDERSARLILDKFCDLYKALPETRLYLAACAFHDASVDEDANHGGLRTRTSQLARGRLTLALGKRS